MALLSPLGIILPRKFAAGDAWGEWSPETLKKLLGYVPEGLRRMADLWKALMPDYGFSGGENASLAVQVISYILSGVLGVTVIGLAVYVIAKWVVRHGK